MMTAELVPLTCASGLGAATAYGAAGLALLYALTFIVSIASTFENPAAAALLPSLVSREAFPRAVAAASTNRALAFATGPALAGLVIAEAGVGATYWTTAVLMTASIGALSCLRASFREPRPAVALDWNAVREGVMFVRHHPVVLGCMTLDMLAVIFGGAAALLPIYATEILHVGARGYGLLVSSLDIGALLCSAVLTLLRPITRAGPALLLSVAIYGVATIVFGLSRWFPLSVAAYMMVGVADQVSVVLRSITIQLTIPDELRGRVSSVNLVFIGASNQLGAAESGFLAALTSPTISVVSGGVASLLVVFGVALVFPELRRYRLGGRGVESRAWRAPSG
jgi:MFS family permease